MSESGESDDAFAPIVAHWQTVDGRGPAPCGREGHTFVHHPGTNALYVHGGCLGSNEDCKILNCLYQYDLKSETWKHIPCSGAIPSAREGHTAIVWNNGLFIFGGRTENEDLFDVHVCDLTTHVWRNLACTGAPPAPKGLTGGIGDSVGSSGSADPTKSVLGHGMRSEHTTVRWEHYVYLFAGAPRADEHMYGDLMRLDLVTSRWEVVSPPGATPCARFLHTAVCVGNEMIVHGGTDNDGGDLDDTWHLALHEHVSRHRWVEGAPSEVTRCAHGACVDTRHQIMFIFGGSYLDEYIDLLTVYDVPSRRWHEIRCQIGPAPEPRTSHTLVSVNQDVYVFGGCGGEGEWLYDLSVMTMAEEGIAKLIRSRDGHHSTSEEGTMSLPAMSHREPTTPEVLSPRAPTTTLDDFLSVKHNSTQSVSASTATGTFDCTLHSTAQVVAPPQVRPVPPVTPPPSPPPGLPELFRLILQIQDRLDHHAAEVNARMDDMGRRLDRATEGTNQRIRELRDAVYSTRLPPPPR